MKSNVKKKTRLIDQGGFRLWLLSFPFLILIFLFSYLPLYGWVYALFDYKPGRALTDCKFLGLGNFTRMFADKYALEDIVRVMKNTLGMSLIGIATSGLPMMFAVFLAEPVADILAALTTGTMFFLRVPKILSNRAQEHPPQPEPDA